MSIDGFLTLLSLIVAVFAVLPRSRQLELTLHVKWWEKIVALFWFFFTLYLQFYRSFFKLSLTPHLDFYHKYALTTNKMAYLASLILIVYFLLIFKFRPLNKGSIKRFQDLLSELLTEQRWAELFGILEKRLAQLFKIYSGNLFTSRIRKFLNPKEASLFSHVKPEVLLEVMSNDGDFQKLPRRPFKLQILDCLNWSWKLIGDFLLRFVPTTEQAEVTAHEIVEEILLSKFVVENLSLNRPYLALEVISFPFRENKDFIELYLKSLHRNPKSILYKEIKDNLNTNSLYRYCFPQKNRLLIALIKNSNVAVGLQVWRPIGESVISFLDEQKKLATDPYCSELNNYDTEGRYDCPIQNGIWFFDLMVTEAFFSDTSWHMWLYYFNFFAERILKNIKDNDDEDDERSYPTRYHFILEQLVTTLCNWIKMIEKSTATQKNIFLKNTEVDHENGNIPKSAILCLGTVTGKINGSTKITSKFKTEQLHHIFDLYFSLISSIQKHEYAEALAKSIRYRNFFGLLTSRPDH